MRTYVDANVFLYAVLYDDARSQRCRKALEAIVAGRLEAVTSLLTWDEFSHVVERILGREVAVQEGERFVAVALLAVIGICAMLAQVMPVKQMPLYLLRLSQARYAQGRQLVEHCRLRARLLRAQPVIVTLSCRCHCLSVCLSVSQSVNAAVSQS